MGERQREFIITENGLEIPRSKGLERLEHKLVVSPLGKTIVMSAWSMSSYWNNNEVWDDILTKIDRLQVLVQIEEDFDRGRVKGRIVKEGDPSLRHLTIDEMGLALDGYRQTRKQRRHQKLTLSE